MSLVRRPAYRIDLLGRTGAGFFRLLSVGLIPWTRSGQRNGGDRFRHHPPWPRPRNGDVDSRWLRGSPGCRWGVCGPWRRGKNRSGGTRRRFSGSGGGVGRSFTRRGPDYRVPLHGRHRAGNMDRRGRDVPADEPSYSSNARQDRQCHGQSGSPPPSGLAMDDQITFKLHIETLKGPPDASIIAGV